ncbi:MULTISPECIES: hypothetical protein [unclassified Saccharothrix]|uniref:hypothetical protein n=1 Tax=unclassified Saccharothrix TaxID=2593673 RepID=UPI00307F2928
MTSTKKRSEALPMPAEKLEALAAYYDDHDTSSEMEDGEWVDPRPMKTTSLRLPTEVVDALKSLAQARGQRYTAFVREIVEQVVTGTRTVGRDEVVRSIDRRLARIEKVVEEKPVEAPRRRSMRPSAAAALRRSSVTARKLAGGRSVSGKLGMKVQPKGGSHRNA